jgi:diguanylate cyclase (GGDEF)-like protein
MVLLYHLVGFSILAITGLLIGHLRDLQIKSQLELKAISDQNLKLSQLTLALEAANQLSIELIGSQDWLDRLSVLLTQIGKATRIDHLVLMQLSGEGSDNLSIQTQHYWKEDNNLTDGIHDTPISAELRELINQTKVDQLESGNLKKLSSEIRSSFDFSDFGEYAILPIYANTALWGYLGFENNQPEILWEKPEINTYRSITKTLGSIIYRKLIEDHLNLRARELDSLQESSSEITSSDQLEAILQSILSQILDLTPAYDTSVYLHKRDGKLDHYISLGKNQQQSLPFSHPGEMEISQLVKTTSQDLYISNIKEFNEITTDSIDQPEAVISFSLKTGNEIIGVLNIWYASPREFEEEEKNILRLLADQTATAILNLQLLEAEREQRHLADSLRKANILLTDNLDLEQVLERILKQVLALVSARDCNIFLYDGENLEFGAVMYKDDVQHDPVHAPSTESIYYKAARSGEKFFVENIETEENLTGSWKKGSLVCLPLIFHQTVIGIMNISFFEPGTPDDQFIQTLDLLSNQAAIAINNARTFEAEREQRQLAQALQKTGQAIQSSLDLEIVLDQILTQISTVIPYHSANLILIEDGNAIVVRHQGYAADLKPVRSFDVTRFVTLEKMTESKKPVIIPDTENDSDWIKTETTETILSWAGAPILDGEKVIGFLSLNHENRNFYDFHHADTLTAFASQAAIALVHARLHKEIQELAITDPLTNILNRRGLNQWGQYEIDRAKRFSSPLSAIFFDLDNFKEINDNYGHDIGDIVLQEVVKSCQEVIRKIDIFSRIGGEEFLVILPETPLQVAVQIAERLRKAVAKKTIECNSHQINLTISLGVVELTAEISDLPDLIVNADKYMYESKQSGRNRSSYPVESLPQQKS